MRNSEIEELKKDYEIIINRLRDAIFYGDKRDEEGLRSAASDCQEQAEKLGYYLKSSVKDGNLVAIVNRQGHRYDFGGICDNRAFFSRNLNA